MINNLNINLLRNIDLMLAILKYYQLSNNT